jgi:hypothetical protein
VTRRLRRTVVVSALALAGVLAVAAPASAHPLGNFTVNTAAAVVVEPSAVRVDVVVDHAEIPTRQVFPDVDDASGTLPGGPEAPARAMCDDVADAAALTIDGRPAALTVTARELVFPPGAAGLRTARLTCQLRTEDARDLVGSAVAFDLAPVSPAPGWRETTAIGDGVRLAESDVPTGSTTGYLREYPEEQLATPLDVPSARVDVVAGTGVATGVGGVLGADPPSVLPRGADRITEAFTDLVARERLTVPFGALAVGVALLLGALHAFAPGHGKTVMAAYLVGGRGSLREALVIGASVTVTHTLGVLVLGAVLSVVGLASPELAYPVLGTASGVLLIGIGVVLLRAALQRAPRPSSPRCTSTSSCRSERLPAARPRPRPRPPARPRPRTRTTTRPPATTTTTRTRPASRTRTACSATPTRCPRRAAGSRGCSPSGWPAAWSRARRR